MREPATVAEAFEQAKTDLAELADNLRDWAEHHLISPREVTVWCEPERRNTTTVWLLTDHLGEQDSSCRVVFDPAAKAYGLEQTLIDGTEWYMGPYEGSFADVVRSI
jgi:hypothetical protein